jgi:hypothetical protein
MEEKLIGRGNMDTRRMYSYKENKYSKGYEVHKPQHGSKPGQWEEREVSVGNDLPHYKWRDGPKDVGHIFFKD